MRGTRALLPKASPRGLALLVPALTMIMSNTLQFAVSLSSVLKELSQPTCTSKAGLNMTLCSVPFLTEQHFRSHRMAMHQTAQLALIR